MEKIRINNLSFYYDKYAALEDINININESGFICLVGPNGSGKSTLLKCITGLMKLPDNRIFINGKDINSYKVSSLAEQISYVPQISAPIPGFTVGEIVEMGRHPYKPSHRDREIIDYALKVTNTRDFTDKDCSEISGGEFQRVMIARAIAQDTPIMILDEPVSHLDIRYQIDIIESLKRLSGEKNTLIVISMHDLNLAMLYSDKVILLDRGRLHSFGTRGQVLNKENITNVYKINISEVRVSEDIRLIYPAINS
jgi:iron complex transport system ATP-binding protein